jgi:methylenetetrahydrofolate reductase (NADPH)
VNKLTVQNLVQGYSIETTIREAKQLENFSDIVPAGTSLYVVHVPGDDFKDTVALAARLRREGMEPVPHIVARRIDSLSILDDFLRRFTTEAGVRQVLLVAGDIATPVGQIGSSLQILDSGLLEKHRVRTIGVAGHPEGHRDVDDATLRDSLKRKNAYARKTGAKIYIVTQFTFAADPIIAWEKSHGADIGELPITVGLPGLASAKTLLKYAMACGIGASLQAFSKRAGKLTKLLTVSAPDDTLVGLARYKGGTPQTRIHQIHFFPFGGFKRTAEWANNIIAGNFDITDHGRLRVSSTASVR